MSESLRPRRSSFPLWIRVVNYCFAALFLWVLVMTWSWSLGALIGSLLLAVAVVALCLQPVRAHVEVDESKVVVSTVLGVRTLARSEVRRWRPGVVGPVIQTNRGEKVRATAPIPPDTWLFSLRERRNV